MNLDSALSFALEAAARGGQVAMKHFGKHEPPKRKTDGTWVTEADLAVEAQLRLLIARSWPDHNILGEEEGLSAAGGGPTVPGAPTWILDPIDGTHNYMNGIPIWATLIGLRMDDAFTIGVCHAPALGETYDGGIGLGARMNGTAIAARRVESLADATVLYGSVEAFGQGPNPDLLDRLVERAWRTRGLGDFWGHMLVARGAADVMVEPELNLWDYAALVPIATEAGALITQFDGSDLNDVCSCVTGGPGAHEQIVRLARGLP
ncbi:MAG: inositol monophosphatase family protein [Actinomycetota bacterium]